MGFFLQFVNNCSAYYYYYYYYYYYFQNQCSIYIESNWFFSNFYFKDFKNTARSECQYSNTM